MVRWLAIVLLALLPATAWSQKPFRRAVPNHASSVLDGCSAEHLGLVMQSIEGAISVGAPAYNEGRIEDCFRTYERTAIALGAKLTSCSQVKAALDAGVARAATFSTFKDKAWAMRDAFDGLLEAIHRKAPQATRRRTVPRHAPAILTDCKRERVLQIEGSLADAISLGAPAYNEGDVETCFKIYEQAALSLDRRVVGCDGLRGALKAGLKDAATLETFTDKAWAMRDAFDGVLEVIARTPPDAFPARERSVPDYDEKIFEGCPKESVQRLATALQEAIALGAPLLDSGAATAGHAVYKKTAAELRRTLEGCSRIKEALRAGVADAKNYPNDADKAWALRDVFDGLLRALAKPPRR